MQPTTVSFFSFAIFVGIAMSITAFPVLARILSERKLLATNVGQIALSSAAVDDVIAWVLLLIDFSLIGNTENYINALYVFLVAVAWVIFLFAAVRPLLRRLNELSKYKDNITELKIFLTFIILFISSWFTQSIGVHQIFGAFVAGLVVPHEHGYAVKVAEKIEDLVTIVLLPLFFAYAGLFVRLDKLDSGLIWAMVFFVIASACFGKVLGSFFVCRISGMNNRESLAVGVLINTKGLVELIVLNIGLGAGVLNETAYTMYSFINLEWLSWLFLQLS